MAFKDHTVTIEFSVTKDYSYSDTASVVAKTLGISLAALRKIVNGDEELTEVTEKAIAASDVNSEDVDVYNVESEEE